MSLVCFSPWNSADRKVRSSAFRRTVRKVRSSAFRRTVPKESASRSFSICWNWMNIIGSRKF